MGTRGQIKAWLLSLALALGAAACDDSKEEAPPDSGGGGFTNRDATADSAQPDGGTPEEDAGTEDAEAPDGGESCEASKAEADEKEWAEGCYKCAPETSAQLLNSCGTGFRSFDPENYPSGWQPGDDLPPLP
jgi:hypothetical protein